MTGEKINKPHETSSLAGRNDGKPFFQAFDLVAYKNTKKIEKSS
jgi:hypothetical protein